MIYLLDTNTCIEYLRQRSSRVIQRIDASSAPDLRLCSVVKAELYVGVYRSQQRQKNLSKVSAFVQPFISLPFDDVAADIYGQIRADLESQGLPIGPYDLMIAAIALANGCTLVTHNTAEFSRVSGLVIEDWQSP